MGLFDDIEADEDPRAAKAFGTGLFSDIKNERDETSAAANIAKPITSLPGHYRDIVRGGQDLMSSGLEDLRKPTGGDLAESAMSTIKGLGKLAGGAAQYTTAPFFAPARSFLTQPVEDITGLPKEYSEFALSLGVPIPKRIPLPRGAQAETPTAEALLQRASGKYDAAKEADFAVAPDMTEMVKGQLTDSLRLKGFRPENPQHKAVFDAIDELPVGKYADVSDFQTARQAIQNSGANREAVRTGIRGIDDFVAPKVPELEGANLEYASGMRSREFTRAMEKAENYKTSYDLAVRDQAKNLLNNKTTLRGWSEEERAALEGIAQGQGGPLAASKAASALGGKGGWWGVLTGVKTGGAAPAAGFAMQKLAESLTRSNVAKLDVMLRSRPQLARQLRTPFEDWARHAEAAQVSPTATNLSRLTLASRNLSTNLKDADINIAPNDLLKSLFGKPAEADEQ